MKTKFTQEAVNSYHKKLLEIKRQNIMGSLVEGSVPGDQSRRGQPAKDDFMADQDEQQVQLRALDDQLKTIDAKVNF